MDLVRAGSLRPDPVLLGRTSGYTNNGSYRWIGHGFFIFQPSELGRLAAIFFMAWWFSRYEKVSSNWLYGFVLPLAILAAI